MYHYKKICWQYTVGLVLTIGNGSNFEQQSEKGFTHIAEHLCFSGTKHWSEKELANRICKQFWHLDAVTNSDSVRFKCIIEKELFCEAIETLQQMVFEWVCSKDQWKHELNELVTEAKIHTKDDVAVAEFDQKQKLLKGIIDLSETQLTPLATARLRSTHIKNIEQYWKRLLHQSRRYLTIIGNLDSKELSDAQHTLLMNNPQISAVKHNEARWSKISNEYGTAIVREQSAAHILGLLLNEIFMLRTDQSDIQIDFTQTIDASVWFVLNRNGNSKLKNEIMEVLLQKPSEAEFTIAKKTLLRFWQRCSDGIDSETALSWFSGFTELNYAPFYTTNDSDYFAFLESSTYTQFLEFFDPENIELTR